MLVHDRVRLRSSVLATARGRSLFILFRLRTPSLTTLLLELLAVSLDVSDSTAVEALLRIALSLRVAAVIASALLVVVHDAVHQRLVADRVVDVGQLLRLDGQLKQILERLRLRLSRKDRL